MNVHNCVIHNSSKLERMQINKGTNNYNAMIVAKYSNNNNFYELIEERHLVKTAGGVSISLAFERADN